MHLDLFSVIGHALSVGFTLRNLGKNVVVFADDVVGKRVIWENDLPIDIVGRGGNHIVTTLELESELPRFEGTARERL